MNEKLQIKAALYYPFSQDGWLGRYIGLMLLLLVPVFGWLVVAGYMLRVINYFRDERYEELPDLSNLGELFVAGLMMAIAGIIFALPSFLFGWIPCIGSIVSFAWGIIMAFAMPYVMATVAKHMTLTSEVFDFAAIIRYIQDNIVNILIAIVVGLFIGMAIFIIILPFIGGMGIIGVIAGNADNTVASIFGGGTAVLLAIVMGIIIWIVSIYSQFVQHALVGNIYGIWKRGQNQ